MKNLLVTISFFSLFLSTSLYPQWYQQYSGVHTNFYSFFSIDGTTAWATGANGVILKTTNSGASWIQKSSGTSYSISFVHFFNPSEGIVAGSGGTIKKTYDGGETWESIYGGTYNRLQEGCFVNDSVGYICGDAGILLKTTDRGETWTSSVITASNFAFIYFVNETTGLATTEYTGQIWKTTDAGNTWSLKQVIGNYSVWQIHFADQNNGWVVGEYGTIAHTTNAGESWNLQYSGTNVNLRSVYFFNPDTGWVVGKDEKRLRTTNGGNTWIHDHTGYSYEYLYIYFYDNLRGWIIGTSGVILHTENGGITIQPNVFERNYGGFSIERGTAFALTDENGYMVVGRTSSYSPNDSWLLMCLDSSGYQNWAKVFNIGGYGHPHHIDKTPDGNYLISGFAESGLGQYDAILVKVDVNGNILWKKSIGSTDFDEFRRFSIENDGDIIVSGYTASFGGTGQDGYIVKFDSDGNKIWEKIVGSAANEQTPYNFIDDNGFYVFSGFTENGMSGSGDGIVIKCDTLGNIIWSKSFGGSGTDVFYHATKTIDGNYLFTGSTSSFGLNNYIYLVETDQDGNVLWSKAFGSSGFDFAYHSVVSNDGSIIICGYTSSFGFGGNDAFLMKCAPNGNLIWFKTYGGIYSDYAYFVKTNSLNEILFTGWSHPQNNYNEELYFVKTNANGISSCAFLEHVPNVVSVNSFSTNLIYNSTTGGILTNPVIYEANVQPLTLTDCNIIIPVELKSFNYQIDGNDVILLWTTATELNNMGFNIIKDETEIGFIPGAGTTTELRNYTFKDENVKQGNFIYTLIQTDYDGTKKEIGKLQVNVDNIPTEYLLYQNYPNPFNPNTKIQYSIPQNSFVILNVYNSLGERVSLLEEGMKEAGYYETVFNGSNLPSGIYFYTLSSDKFISTKKMILLK